MEFFKCRNFSTATHWTCYAKKLTINSKSNMCGECISLAVKDNISLEKTCGYHSAYAQMDFEKIDRCSFPQITDVTYLDRFYPNAKFILLARDAESWLKSVIAWRHNMQVRILRCFLLLGIYKLPEIKGTPLPAITDKTDFTEKFYKIHNGDQILKDVFNSHVHNTIRRFRGRPNKLLYVNITDCKLEEKMLSFLDLKPLKDKCFGHSHVSKNKNEIHNCTTY
jgi:hypothetical protein